MPDRPTPYDLVFAGPAEARFRPIEAALEAAGADPIDRDAFLMLGDVVQLVRDLRPDDGLGEGIRELAALVHHAWLHWAAGRPVVDLDRSALDREPGAAAELPGAARYVRLPYRLVWAETVPGAAAEPLDGCFIHPVPAGLRALGVFGLHPGRPGFTVVEVEGPRPRELVRPDGSTLFSPVLAGGGSAGLLSLTGGEELLELAWRLGATA